MFGAIYCLRRMFFRAIILKMAGAEEVVFVKDTCKNKSNKCRSSEELSEFLKSSIKNILDHVTDEQFVSIYKACYREFDKKDEIFRPALSGSSAEGRKYHSQFNDIIMKSTFKTIEETVSNMSSKLRELEELKQSQSNSNSYWRPPGNAYEHMIPFEFMSQTEKKKDLEGKIEREQEALSILKTRLIQKRNKAKQLNEVLLCLMSEIKNTVTSKVNDDQSAVEAILN